MATGEAGETKTVLKHRRHLQVKQTQVGKICRDRLGDYEELEKQDGQQQSGNS